MNQMSMPAKLTPKQVLGFMGLGEEVQGQGMPPVAWFLIQAQAEGTTDGAIAQALGITEEDLIALRDSVTQMEGTESEEAWARGILALRVAQGMNEQRLATGWDAVEAMALDKLGNQLAAMQGNGNWEDMLDIATKANKAIRRNRGEGANKGFGTVSITTKLNEGSGAGMELDMKSGEIGSLRLTLSPRIREQLGDPNRTIESTAHKVVEGEARKVAGQNLEMLRLKEAREIVDSSGLDSEEKPKTENEIKKALFDVTGLKFDE